MKQDQFGGFGRRLIAFLIDIFIISILTSLIHYAGTTALATIFDDETLQLAGTISFLVFCLLSGLYFILFHGATGQTPGKRIVGLKLVQESGASLSYGTAFLRWVGGLISAFFLFLGFFWIAIDGKKQGWHDKIAKTKVVKVDGHDQFHITRYDGRIASI